MKLRISASLVFVLVIFLSLETHAAINSESNGSDGSFEPAVDTIIDMQNRPNGIYQFKSIKIPSGVTVSFKRNSANSPVVWLVQENCVIDGIISLNGVSTIDVRGGDGGPGGFNGGKGRLGSESSAGSGLGPGGGLGSGAGNPIGIWGGNASFGSEGQYMVRSPEPSQTQSRPGTIYGSEMLFPLIGGSGGGGAGDGGGGGGGAILIAASGAIRMNGEIRSNGGDAVYIGGGGGGSGGAIRLVATTVSGNGALFTSGGTAVSGYFGARFYNQAGRGRIRIDAFSDLFNGFTTGVTSRGLQSIILPASGEEVLLSILSIAGQDAPLTPTGGEITPDVIIPGAEQNPLTIVVRCMNVPLNSEITIEIKPSNGEVIKKTGFNSNGTKALSYATISITVPRSGGTIQATARIQGLAKPEAAISRCGNGLLASIH